MGVLAAGDTHYERALVMSIDPGAPSSWDDYYRDLQSQIQAMAHAIVDARTLYFSVATSAAIRAAAFCRLADLTDLLAARLLSVTNPWPAGTAYASQHEERLEQQACPVFCRAWHYYRIALDLDPALERASAQLGAYGSAFARSCVAHRPEDLLE